MYATDFLHRLSLDQDADERAIRRAYARELKLIDQEADAAGFQVLRHAYEMALYWVKHGADRATAAQAHVAPEQSVVEVISSSGTQAAAPVAPPRDAATADDPRELAQAVLADFLAHSASMPADGSERDSATWRKHLQRSAIDERLLNISARAYFEYAIARLLGDSWEPGHEALFIAARQVFGWDEDRRRLFEFGDVGAWLNQAINECATFPQQSSEDCSAQTDAAARLRSRPAPTVRELITHVPHLRALATRFPAWAAIVASRERFDQWQQLEQQIPSWRRALCVRWRWPASAPSFTLRWWQFALIMFFLKTLIGAFGTSHETHPSGGFIPPHQEVPASAEQKARDEALYERAAGRFYVPPGTRQVDPLLLAQAMAQPPRLPVSSQAAPRGRIPNELERKAMFKHVDYFGPHTAPGMYNAEFLIDLDERGAIRKLVKRSASGLPVLDAQIEEAIRAAAPFGAQISRSFTLRYGQRYFLRPRPAAPESAPPAPE